MAITYPITLAQAQAITGDDAKLAAISVAVLSKCDVSKGTWVDAGDHLPELRVVSSAFQATLDAQKTANDAIAAAAATKISQLAAFKANAAQGKLTLADVNATLALIL